MNGLDTKTHLLADDILLDGVDAVIVPSRFNLPTTMLPLEALLSSLTPLKGIMSINTIKRSTTI